MKWIGHVYFRSCFWKTLGLSQYPSLPLDDTVSHENKGRIWETDWLVSSPLDMKLSMGFSMCRPSWVELHSIPAEHHLIHCTKALMIAPEQLTALTWTLSSNELRSSCQPFRGLELWLALIGITSQQTWLLLKLVTSVWLGCVGHVGSRLWHTDLNPEIHPSIFPYPLNPALRVPGVFWRLSQLS